MRRSVRYARRGRRPEAELRAAVRRQRERLAAERAEPPTRGRYMQGSHRPTTRRLPLRRAPREHRHVDGGILLSELEKEVDEREAVLVAGRAHGNPALHLMPRLFDEWHRASEGPEHFRAQVQEGVAGGGEARLGPAPCPTWGQIPFEKRWPCRHPHDFLIYSKMTAELFTSFMV